MAKNRRISAKTIYVTEFYGKNFDHFDELKDNENTNGDSKMQHFQKFPVS